MKNKTLKLLLMMTLTLVGVIFLGAGASAAASEFRADDEQQKIVLTTSMPSYDGSAGYAIFTLGFLININDGSASRTVFLEGAMEYHNFKYSTIISEFNTEHGSAGKQMAENYFYNYNSTMTLNTVFTLFQKGDVYNSSVYGDYRIKMGGTWGYVQAKLNGSSNAAAPTEEVAASNWTSRIKQFPVKFWTWSSKSQIWSTYATRMNNAKTSVYTLSPSTFSASTVQNYSAPYYASDWQNAAILSELGQTSIYAIREYYKRTIVRSNPVNFKVSDIQCDSTITESGTVNVLYSNDHNGKGTQTVKTNLSLTNGSSIDYDLALDTNNYSGCWVTYWVSGYAEGSKTLTATINGGTNGLHTYAESTYSDNVRTKAVTVKIGRDFGVWGLTAYNANGEPATGYSSAQLVENTVCTFQVNWTNYKDIAQSNVKCELYLDEVLFYTDYVSFTGGYQTITRTYTKNIGWGTANRILKARINYANKDSETDPSDNERIESFGVREYKDFSISDLSVSSGSVYENQTLTVTCRTDNWNLYKAYSNIPVELIFNGQVVATQYVSFSAYGIGYHTFTLNVGNGTGIKSIYARINWNDRLSEENTANNQTVSEYITVNSAADAGIIMITPNSNYRAGTEVITSYQISSYSARILIPADNASVRFYAYYYNSSGSLVYLTDSSKSTVIPAYDSNLVYFKWYIPADAAGRYVYLYANVSSDVYDSNSSNNYVHGSQYIYSETTSQAPNTQYEEKSPVGWILSSPPVAYYDTAIWSEWIYVNGSFVKTTYGIRISPTVTITPDNDSPSARYVNGQWQMRSGYGFTLSLYSGRASVSGTVYPSNDAYTAVQRAYASFPEFSYQTVSGNYRTLQLLSGLFQLPANSYADSKRLHYTPLWFPNGNYSVSCYLYDQWTPAGMISARTNSNAILINGSLYDDHYIGRH